MKIGFFGGTFDPIHLGHLHLASELLRIHHLDEVWFCPAQLNPLKSQQNQGASIDHRMKMVQLAIEESHYPKQFKLLDLESRRAGPSYTIDTLKQLTTDPSYAAHQFFLILGEDVIADFLRWRQPEEIIKIVPLLIGQRPSKKGMEIDKILNSLHLFPEIVAAIKKGLTPMKEFDVCATEIRARLHQELSCSHLLPRKVMDYIYQNRLYSSKKSIN